MEAIARKPFQGITNIVWFNWHFYVVALACLVLLYMSALFLSGTIGSFFRTGSFLLLASIGISLLASFYVYDLSGLYKLDWLQVSLPADAALVNVHAGFDETSALLAQKYPQRSLLVFDFYDEEKHTELSIRRARKRYPPYPGTREVSTTNIPLREGSADAIFCLLAAHEIRDSDERIQFFQQLRKGLKEGGKLIVVEHLRDLPNFLAYNIGFFHFYSGNEWRRTFELAGFHIDEQQKQTPFITAYTLSKNGTSS